ncbi:hypothetical protein IH981_01250 [Patescibacteria group bacterium]|nr:hypothetical protein [Patescibacteria group bacterium]
MNDAINLLQNDPLVFVLLAVFAGIIVSLFIFSAYLHLIPTSIALQYKQLRDQPIVYFGTIGIFLAIVVVVMILSLGSPKQEVETREAKFLQVYATVTKVNEKNNTLVVKDSTNGIIYQIVVDETTEFTKENKSANLSQIGIGDPVTVKTKKIPEQGNKIFAVEIILVPTVVAPGGQETIESEGNQQ